MADLKRVYPVWEKTIRLSFLSDELTAKIGVCW